MTARPTAARLVANARQFIKFGIVGGSGTVVNLVTIYVFKKLAELAEVSEHDAFVNLLGSQFNIRWYHVFMTLGFLLSNVWNYQLNRMWTFKGANPRSWWRGFVPFLVTGLGAFVFNMVALTLLMNETSPIALPTEIFDDSTGLRTKVYWASAIAIVVAMPVNFVINKLWTFRGPRLTVVERAEPSGRADAAA